MSLHLYHRHNFTGLDLVKFCFSIGKIAKIILFFFKKKKVLAMAILVHLFLSFLFTADHIQSLYIQLNLM